MVQKLPPPPPIANQDPAFNRWLLELTAILAAGGGIDPNSVDGLSAVILESAQNTVNIAALTTTVNSQGGSIIGLGASVATINVQIAGINAQITALGARAQVFSGNVPPAAGLGVNNDWYYNTAGAAGARLYIKIAGAWAAQAI